MVEGATSPQAAEQWQYQLRVDLAEAAAAAARAGGGPCGT